MILPGNESKTLPIIIYEEMRGTIVIKGRSISPEVESYFADFTPYLDECVSKNPMDLKIDIDLEYFNTKTAKIMIKMLDTLKKVVETGFKVDVTWFYEADDEDMYDAGLDYEELSKLKFNFVEKPSTEKPD